MSESNGTNGAAAVAEPGAIQEAIRSVANVVPADRPFSIPPGLAKKLAKARQEVKGVAKNGQNSDQNYAYVRAEDVVKEAGKALAEADVIVAPPELKKFEFSDLSSRSGSNGKFALCEFTFRVIDGESGEGFETTRIGTATDYPGDKAIYKAETGAMKYFLSGLLSIPLGDGESDPETTRHAKGGAKISDESPASGKQKDLVKKLIGEKNLPKPARMAIVDFVGGSEPKKGTTSHAIDQLMNGDPLAFARECGWDGSVEEPAAKGQNATAESAPTEGEPAAGQQSTQQQTDDRPPLPAAEGEALVRFCREKGATLGELATVLRSIGTDLPPNENLTDDIVVDAVRNVPIAQVARVKQMVAASYESKKATAEAEQQESRPDENQGPADQSSSAASEIDPKSPLGKATERVAALGYKSEFENLAWLLFDTDQVIELDEVQLTQLTGLLERASAIGIQQASVAACIRNARETRLDVATRAERFEGWIANREQNAQATQAAEEAHNAAEAPQQ